MDASPSGALVLFSGGQDSTVCLPWALSRFARLETVGFDYGRRPPRPAAHHPPSPERPRPIQRPRRQGQSERLESPFQSPAGGAAWTTSAGT